MSPRQRPMTMPEHIAELKASGRYEDVMAVKNAREAERLRRALELGRAEEPLVAELRAAGLNVNSVWDLVNTRAPYRAAVPILLQHLHRPYPPEIREGIARALGVRSALPHWPVLFATYKDEPNPDVKDGLAVTLQLLTIAEPGHLAELIELVRDRRHGSSRVLLLSALSRSRRPEASATLAELKDDPDLVKQIAIIFHQKELRAKRKARRSAVPGL